VQSLVRSLRPPACAFALAGLGACFVEPPPVTHETDTLDPCAMDDTACTCTSGRCDASTSTTASGDGTTTQPGVDTSAGEGPSGESVGAASSDDDSSSDDGVVDTGESSGATETTGGGETCQALVCAECVGCVDGEGQACAAAYAACDEVNGCGTAVTCLVTCGLGIDCLNDCCEGLDAQQLEVVNDLIWCKSDECVEPCNMTAEFHGCP
jgi:hypothetical protein